MRGRMRLNVLIIICCVTGGIVTSCVNYYYISEEMRVFPKRPAYTLQGKLPREASLGVIDPDALYVLEKVNHETGDKRYHYYRFWEDGHVLHRSVEMKHPPTHIDAETFFGIDMGYYIIEGQILLIELFAPYNGGNYFMTEIEMIGGNLVKKKSWLRDIPSVTYDTERIYYKVSLGRMIREPDW